MAKKRAPKNNQQPDVVNKSQQATYADIDHGKMITWINEADDATATGRELSEKARRYYDSDQWTAEEIAKLAAQRQAATVINRIKPKMDGLMGMERVNKTTAKAFPRTPKHQGAAVAATESIRFVLQDNTYSDIRSSCWDNIVVEGTAGSQVIVDEKNGDFRITIEHIMWDRLIYDPHSRRKDFSDARYLGIVKWMDHDEAMGLYPNGADVLETTLEGSATYDDKPRWMDNTRNRVKIVELYYRKGNGNVWYACFTRGGYLKEPAKSPFINEEGETEWPYEFASAFVSRDGVRYGAVRQLTDIQDEINKRRSKALHLMSVRQVRWERGAVEDINKARAELAKPDGVIETTPGMEFEILKTGDMAAAQFNLLTEAKQEIDAVSFSSAAAGKEVRNMSGVALRSREMASQTELAPMFDVLRGLDIRVYRKVWNRIKQYWKAEKWIRVTDDDNNLKFVGLNKPQTAGEVMLQKAQAQGLPPEQLQMLAQRIQQDPSMQEVVSTENDIAELDMDIIIEDSPDAITTQAEDFAVLGEMVKSGFQMPPEAVIEASPLASKDKILKMMREQKQQAVPPQIQEQMQKMQEEMQKLAQENQGLKQGAQTDMAKVEADHHSKMKALELDEKIASEKARIAREQFEFNKQLEIDKANHEIDLSERKAKSAHDQKNNDMEFDHGCRMREEQSKSDIAMQTDVGPKVEQALGSEMATGFSELSKTILMVAQAMIESNAKPKQVSMSNVNFKRDAAGKPTGVSADVNQTVQ